MVQISGSKFPGVRGTRGILERTAELELRTNIKSKRIYKRMAFITATENDDKLLK